MKVANNHVVTIHYTLTDETGELIDGVGWMQEVRKIRANRPRWDEQPENTDPVFITVE